MKTKKLIIAIHTAILLKDKVKEQILWTKLLTKSLKHKKTFNCQ